MASCITNDINSSSTLFINNINNQAINIGNAGGLTTIVSGLTLSNGTTLNVGTNGSTSFINMYGLLTLQPNSGNTITINSTATSSTLSSNSFYTAGGIGVSLASYFGSTIFSSGIITANSGLTVTNGSTLNVGTSGTTSNLNVYGLLTSYNGITSTAVLNNFGSTTFAVSSTINMGGNIVNNVGTPSLASDIASKGYVDSVANGLSVKQSVNVATTTAGTITNYTITSIPITTNANLIITCTNTLIANQSIVITGTNSTPSINGTYTISASNGTTFTIPQATCNSWSTNGFTLTLITTTNAFYIGMTVSGTNFTTAKIVSFTSGSGRSGSVVTLDTTQSTLTGQTTTLTGSINITVAGTTGNIAEGLGNSFANGAVIDTHTILTGERILIKNQANLVENGIYTINATGAPTRSVDLAYNSHATGIYTFVEQGSVNINAGFVCSNPSSNDIVGTAQLSFTQFSGAGQLIAGTNIGILGNTISVIDNPSFSNGLTVTGGTSVSLQIPTTISLSTGTNLSISNTSTSSQTPLTIYQSSLSATGNVNMNIGVSNTTNNSGIIQFNYLSSGSTTNKLQFRLQGTATPALTIDGSNNIVINGTTTSNLTSGTNLSLVNTSITSQTLLTMYQGSLTQGFLTTMNIGVSGSTNLSGIIQFNYVSSGTPANNTLQLSLQGQTGITIDGNNKLIVGTSSLGSISIPNTTGTSLTISSTTQSTGTSSGSVILSGGLGVGGNIFGGGTINSTGTINSGADINATSGTGIITSNSLIVNTIPMTPSSNDIIKEVPFTNNNVLPHTTQNVTGLAVNISTCRAFKTLVSVSITCSSSANNLYQLYELIGIYTNATSSWYFNPEILGGDVSGIVFTILSTGQIQYALSSIPAGTFSGLKINFKLMSLTQ